MTEPGPGEPVPFAIVGVGWRAEFFLRVARELPQRFRVSGVVARDAAVGARVTAEWGVPAYRDLGALLTAAPPPAFVVVSVPRRVAPDLLAELAEHDVAALTETPPAADLEGLLRVWELVARGACIQVAEQYAFQPLHAARLAVVRSGQLGLISQAQVSAAHDYHGISLIRHLLDVTFEDSTIAARRIESPIVDGPTRRGPPTEDRLTTSVQIIAQLDFGDRLGIYDFTNDQYHSWIRSPRLLVRGERGEINDLTVRFLADFRTPVEAELRRQDTGHGGNLEGHHHVGVRFGTEWVYRNPFAPARLADDEIAVATCLEGMARHVAGGPQSIHSQLPPRTSTSRWSSPRRPRPEHRSAQSPNRGATCLVERSGTPAQSLLPGKNRRPARMRSRVRCDERDRGRFTREGNSEGE